ncbi:MAG TPA: hypothetical protein EYQ00_15420, partial [Dehalococcoidia bacterium]|nr:hypothetical protein [Dehalococcoidia bacterium]
MNNLNDKTIEDIFAEIRAKFEKRKNETGLDILDNYEAQWAESQSLSDRQIAWLESQLDGSWMQRTASSNDSGTTPEQESDIIQFPAMDRDMERRIDAMISRKLTEPGKAIVDLKQLDQLEAAIDDIVNEAIVVDNEADACEVQLDKTDFS